MSKKYVREENIIESLERQIRELKAINRSLNKRLKKITRGYKSYLDKDVEEKEPKKQEEQKICWDCGKGIYELKIVLNRRFRQCSVCNKRGKVKVIEDEKT